MFLFGINREKNQLGRCIFFKTNNQAEISTRKCQIDPIEKQWNIELTTK